MPLTYRTAGAWGPATVARNLYASEFDENNWYLYELIAAIQADLGANVGIVDITESAGNLYVTLSNSSMLGPFPIPVYSLADSWRGPWNATTGYNKGDVVTYNGSAYVVLYPHTSAGTFDPSANDGGGHNYYGLIFTAPTDVIPLGGTTGQALLKHSDADLDDEWATLELANLGDVALGSPHDVNDLLAWNGSYWTNKKFPTYDDLTGSVPWSALNQLTPQFVASVAGVLTIDATLGEICVLTLLEDVTSIVVTGASPGLSKITLFITNNASWAITAWMSGTIWAGGSPPTITTGAGAQDIVTLLSYNNGFNYYGNVVGQGYA